MIILLIFLFGLTVPLLITVFGFFAIISDLKGAPFVPTQSSLILQILAGANLKPGQVFLELGSGDGRVTRLAVKKFGVIGRGVDIHPLLVWYANWVANFQLLNAHFNRQDFFQTDLGQADVIFVFLHPKSLKKLAAKFLSECQSGTLIISHGFKIAGLEQKLIKTQKRRLFSTYFYRL